MAIAFLGLGSNLGNKVDNINLAIKLLGETEQIDIKAVSSLYVAEPVGVTGQPDFYNCAVRLETELDPHSLLECAKAIELKLGRRPGTHQKPREIDIDILLYDDSDMESIDLKIPHPRIKTRRFVLEPLLELNPDLKDPVTAQPLKEYLVDVIEQRVRRVGDD
jgi:2-amino-4-hydroxy-6-hydroxymethyldihydropteridine diphosphokinase